MGRRQVLLRLLHDVLGKEACCVQFASDTPLGRGSCYQVSVMPQLRRMSVLARQQPIAASRARPLAASDTGSHPYLVISDGARRFRGSCRAEDVLLGCQLATL